MKHLMIHSEKIKSILYRLALIPAIGLLCYVFFFSLMDWGAAPFFNQRFSNAGRIGLSVLGICILFAIFCFLNQRIQRGDDKKLHIIGWVLFGIFIMIQVSYLITMRVGLRYDALKTLDEAVAVLKTGSVSSDHFNGYFARYTNNYSILFLTVLLLKVFDFFMLTGMEYANAVFLLGLVNILFIDIGILFTWKLGTKIKGEKAGMLCLLFCLFQPLFLIWTPFYYTNTISMGIMMAGIYGGYHLLEGKGKGRQSFFYAFLTGILLAAGFKIRATVIITIIAFFLYVFLGRLKIEKEIKEREIKTLILKIGCVAVGVAIVFGSHCMLTRHYVSFDTTDTAFPAMHWIAMGAGGRGVYNIVDEYYTIEHNTKQEKKDADKELFLKRVEELGAGGYIRLMFHKLRLTFSDGSGGYLSELGVSQKYNSAHFYFLGGKSDFLGAYTSVYYSFCLLLALLGEVLDFIKKRKSFLFILQMNLLGAFLFHMIWEAGTIYSIGFMTLLPLCMLAGFAEGTRVGKKAYLPIGAAGIFVLGVCFVLQHSKFTRECYVTNEANVNQYLFQCNGNETLEVGTVYLQSFIAYKKFNAIGIQVLNLSGDDNDSIYKISLLNQDKKVLVWKEAEARKCVAYDFIRMEFDTIDKSKKEKYYIRIEKVAGSKGQGLTFLTYNTGNYDAYCYGNLFITIPETKEFQMETMRDLSFCVYEKRETPYFR